VGNAAIHFPHPGRRGNLTIPEWGEITGEKKEDEVGRRRSGKEGIKMFQKDLFKRTHERPIFGNGRWREKRGGKGRRSKERGKVLNWPQ